MLNHPDGAEFCNKKPQRVSYSALPNGEIALQSANTPSNLFKAKCAFKFFTIAKIRSPICFIDRDQEVLFVVVNFFKSIIPLYFILKIQKKRSWSRFYLAARGISGISKSRPSPSVNNNEKARVRRHLLRI